MSDALDYAAGNQIIRDMRAYLTDGGGWEDPRPLKKLHANHAHRHDHTDELDRCECGRFLPSDQQRVMCSCGCPNFRWDA